MLCPCCQVPMRPLEHKEIMALTCPQCQGIWISDIALQRLVRRELVGDVAGEAPDPTSIPDLAGTVDAANSTGELDCSLCKHAMAKDRFHPMIPVEIDHCESCRYTWLDAGEQALILRLYLELMNSDDPDLADKRDKLDKLEQLHEEMMGDRKLEADARRVELNFGQFLAMEKMKLTSDGPQHESLSKVISEVAQMVWVNIRP